VPLSVEAQLEARMLMLAPNNIFSPSSGKPIMTPTQDITLGCYYLTAEPRKARKEGERLMLVGGFGRAGHVALGVGYFDPTEPRWFYVVRSFEEIDSAISE
jgi:hypothetical protein